MELVAHKEDGILTVSVIGQFWEREDVRQVECLLAQQADGSVRAIVINLERLTFVGSIGLGAMMNLYSTYRDSGCGFYLYRPVGSVQESIELAGFPTILSVVYSKEELEKAMKGQSS